MDIKCPKCQTGNPSDSKYCKECAASLPSPADIEVTETMETPKEELTTGSAFAGRYQIIEELGKGGMGKVYKVHDTKIKEKIALKLIKPEIAKDKKTIERFSNELRLTRKIRHENICQMFDLGEERGTHFITMEFVPGQDLKGLIRQTGQLAVGTTISIAKQICDGLTEAHKLGVIHRDLKPSNIMIDKEGNVRIMDFGIARSLEAKGMTGAGVMIGTPEYMSPEQVEGKETDQRSDIYSLGVILYEMVAGRVPFEGDTPFTIGMKHKSEIPKDPKELNAQIPEDFSHVILRCMEKDKEARYQSAGELLAELGKIEKETSKRILTERKPETEELKWQNSIAVLPFVDLSPERDQEYFCDGMAEELINVLSKVEKLQVASRTSSFQFKEKGYDIHDIGRKLKVKTALEGSIRKAGNRLRITAQLVNVDDGYHLWSEKYDREMEDIFAIQDEISLAIIDKLKLKLLKEEKATFIKRYTDDLEAYDLYLKGRYFWNRRYEGGLQKGLEYFNQTIKKDPLYAPAYAGIADSLSILGLFAWLPPKEAFPKAKATALKAIEIDDKLAEAYTSLGWINMLYDWDWAAAEKALKRALEIDPNYAIGQLWYALYFSYLGRLEEATAEIIKALRLEPLSLLINVNRGFILYFKRLYDEAIEQCLKTIEMDPNYLLSYWFLGAGYMGKGMWKEAISAEEKAVALSEGSPYFIGYLGYAYALSGQKDKALTTLNQLEKLSKEKYVPNYPKAMIYLGLGEKDQMFEYLEKAYEAREPVLALSSKAAPYFDSVRSDPKFKALLKKMGLE
jgi:serine/threonine protein kinase/Flp pilus assembly protein TadD